MINSRLRCGCSAYSGDISELSVTPADTRKDLLDFVWGEWGRTGARCHSVWQAMKDKGQQLREDNFQKDVRGRRRMENCRDCVFLLDVCIYTHTHTHSCKCRATLTCPHINRWSSLACATEVAGIRTDIEINISPSKHEGEKVVLNRANFSFSTTAGISKKRTYQSVEYDELGFGFESFALAAQYQHGTYRHTWVSTHKEHSQTQEAQIRKHSNANRHTHKPLLSWTNTVMYLCTLSTVHSVHPSVYPSLITTPVSSYRLFLLPIPPRIPHSRRLSAN